MLVLVRLYSRYWGWFQTPSRPRSVQNLLYSLNRLEMLARLASAEPLTQLGGLAVTQGARWHPTGWSGFHTRGKVAVWTGIWSVKFQRMNTVIPTRSYKDKLPLQYCHMLAVCFVFVCRTTFLVLLRQGSGGFTGGRGLAGGSVMPPWSYKGKVYTMYYGNTCVYFLCTTFLELLSGGFTGSRGLAGRSGSSVGPPSSYKDKVPRTMVILCSAVYM